MTNGIYAIYDNQAKQYVGGLHLHAADAAAIRMFGDIARDPQTMVARHTEDFELHKLGHVDLTTGVLYTSNEETTYPTVIITGDQWTAVNRPAEVPAPNA